MRRREVMERGNGTRQIRQFSGWDFLNHQPPTKARAQEN
jgi:hypothetical protein